MGYFYNPSNWILCCLFNIVFLFGIVTAANDTDTNTDHHITCEQLLADSSFDLSVIVNTEWKELAYWNVMIPGGEMNNIKFIKPTEAYVKRMSKSNDTHLENVDWSRVELITRTGDGVGGVVVHTDTPGLFKVHVLPNVQYATINKPIPIGMKYLKEGFLMFMNCENLVGVVLTPVNDVQMDPLVVQEKLHRKGFKVFFANAARVKRQASDDVRDGISIGDHDNINDLDSLWNDMKSVINEDDAFF